MKGQSSFSLRCSVFGEFLYKHASLLTKIMTLFMWFFILLLAAERRASFTPADPFLWHLNTNLLYLKRAMIQGF